MSRDGKLFVCQQRLLTILAQFHTQMMAKVIVGKHKSEHFCLSNAVETGWVLTLVMLNTTLLNSRMGLTITNRKKTTTFTAAGQKLLTVPSFKYMESVMSDIRMLDDEIKNHVIQA